MINACRQAPLPVPKPTQNHVPMRLKAKKRLLLAGCIMCEKEQIKTSLAAHHFSY
jgi:hypothetical protein